MRIPLDYYRILGLPIQATAEQLQQAHRDRIQQLPRREFSEAAIVARKQLIDQAYGILSDPVQRQDYDASFLAKSYDLLDTGKLEAEEEAAQPEPLDPEWGIDPYTPCIEIEESQFIGALLILLELGEYELVLRLGRPYLGKGTAGIADGKLGDPEIVTADIVLTVALAYLELGREQWQQGQYENAAASLENGQDLLLQEGLFANIRGEMQSDLFKLRPYRILELVSLPDQHEEARRQGISLLEDMLHDRGGIDGSGDDQSGLGVDDFLRFIQQLRSYLTSAEQQMLFETEARRPSAVATYLAVYALLARGFAQRQPALIRRAKLMLVRLGSHQDVHLEQAVCSLLLGQTEEASRALELSQEFESLAFIRDHSQGSPDLLPGLCLYSERWFQNEVFPHFRDLQQKQAFLTEYFADEDVQAYLEELPTDPAASTPPAAAYPAPSRRELNLSSEAQTIGRDVSPTYASIPSATATMEPGYSTAPSPAATTPAPQTGQTGNQSASRLGRNARERSTPVPQEAIRQPSVNGTRPSARRPARLAANLPANLRLDRILLLAALGLLGLMLLGFLVGKLLNRPQTNTASSSNTVGTNQATPAQTGFSDFVSEQRDTITASAPLDEDNAPEIVKAWLDAKAAAMGENHDIEQLEQILIDPALAQQRARAEDIKAENAHWKFEHSNIEIVSVETDETATSTTDAAEAATTDGTDTANADPTNDADLELDAANNTNEDGQQAAIEALVSEKAEFYTNNQIDTTASYDSTVRVRYSLVRQDGQWRIQEMQVLQ
nr:MAG: DUF4101 domain-containing protein [Leptolyngbya sp. IPPAS B-1204]